MIHPRRTGYGFIKHSVINHMIYVSDSVRCVWCVLRETCHTLIKDYSSKRWS